MESKQVTVQRMVGVQSLAIVRIYFGAVRRKTGGFWQRAMRGPTALRVAQKALDAGFACAIVTEGDAGFVHGGRRVEIRSIEASPVGLPTCLELVASDADMDRFLLAQKEELAESIIVRYPGGMQIVYT